MKKFTRIREEQEAGFLSKKEAENKMYNYLKTLTLDDFVKYYNIYAEIEDKPHIYFMEELDDVLYASPRQIIDNVTAGFNISDKYFIIYDYKHFSSIKEGEFKNETNKIMLQALSSFILENIEVITNSLGLKA